LTEERTKLEQTQKAISTLLQRNQISDRQNYFGFDQNLFIESSNSVAGKKQRIEDLQAQIDECTLKVADFDKKINALKSDESEAEHYRYIKDLMKVIQDTFAEGRELNANNLVVQLNDLANSYLRKLAAQDFHGTIALERKRDDTISIKLLDENNVEVVDPSGAQKTSLYMAVLFAIVELTNKKDENQNSYPLIFDAPTSSFSATREDTFYNIVNNLQQQCVILTKDLILPDGSLDEEKVRKMDCSIYRIRKAEGFNANNLASIQTEVLARKVIND
jgi:DNA sulfur modification protein DndD